MIQLNMNEEIKSDQLKLLGKKEEYLPSFLASYPTADSISLFETIFDQ